MFETVCNSTLLFIRPVNDMTIKCHVSSRWCSLNFLWDEFLFLFLNCHFENVKNNVFFFFLLILFLVCMFFSLFLSDNFQNPLHFRHTICHQLIPSGKDTNWLFIYLFFKWDINSSLLLNIKRCYQLSLLEPTVLFPFNGLLLMEMGWKNDIANCLKR